MMKSKRFEKLEKRPVNQDSFFTQWAEGGLSAMHSPYDPKPGIRVLDGEIVEMDGKTRDSFDSLELFIASYGIQTESAERAMAIPSRDIAKMIVDINVSREEVIAVTTSITPAKMLEVVGFLNPVEMMMGQMKMRVRRTPSNQAIVTNIKDNPALLAADSAEAALRGFAELETTCAVSRNAPMNAAALLVGGQTARQGVMTQCSMEEALELRMGLQGLTSYAETVSVYGTEDAMTDGDDTIWSKGFLASAYASRGIKIRFTSGTGSEVLLGHSGKKSMLYLEILCVYLSRACGVQGVQNGSISCIGITTAVPEGFLAIAAENLVVSLLNMEVASGNDQTFSHSDMRRTAKLLMQMMPGTDFITSGYSATPNFDDLFAGSNTDCDDYDDYYMIQRDMQIDGGIEPVTEEAALHVRRRAAKACQMLYRHLGLPAITDDEIEAATYAYSNEEMPDRNMSQDMAAAQRLFLGGLDAMDIIRGLADPETMDIAENILEMVKQRICGDYLQTASVIRPEKGVMSGLNDPNDYAGPGTGYRLEGERWERLKHKATALKPEKILDIPSKASENKLRKMLKEKAVARPGEADIIVGISPAFANKKIGFEIYKTHFRILENLLQGIREEGMTAEIVKVYHTSDLGEIAAAAAAASRSGIGIGIQSKGLVRINHSSKSPNESLEACFNMPFSDYALYVEVGRNAVAYARGMEPVPVCHKVKPGGLTKYQMTMIRLSSEEKQYVDKGKQPVRMQLTLRK